MDRRDFLRKLSYIPLAGAVFACSREKTRALGRMADTAAVEVAIQDAADESSFRFTGRELFDRVMARAKANGWAELPIGELMGNIGMEMIGIPYKGGTLEADGPEICSINFEGLDCVTLFENTLGMARIVKKGFTKPSDLADEITYTRYREGVLTDYSSRLHYTADWFYDNTRKGVVEDISKELGGIKFPYDVYFMSKKSKYYSALKGKPEMVKKIREYEDAINARDYYYIPADKVKSVEDKLRTGDIVGFATNKKGLDYAHTGLVYNDERNRARLLHASSVNKKVKLDAEIHKYISKIKSDIGISVARPLPVA